MNKPKLPILIFLSILTILVSVSIFNLIKIQQKPELKVVHFGVNMNSVNADEKSAKTEKFIIDRMKSMRDDMQSWAESHKKEISTLLKSKKDNNLLHSMYQNMPNRIEDMGIKRVIMSNYPEFSASVKGFSWQISPQKNEKTDRDIEIKIFKEYEKYKEFVLSEAVCSGNIKVKLWLSGKITKTILGEEVVNGAYEIIEKDEIEIFTPYEFLK